MATRVYYEDGNGDNYWVDVSEKAREQAIDKAMADPDMTMQDGLSEILNGEIVSVGEEPEDEDTDEDTDEDDEDEDDE